MSEKIVMLVLSCDSYNDLWDDFFNLRDQYWPDCPFKWYLVTESMEYNREGVTTFRCGKGLNWSGRFKKAVEEINADYYGLYLDDYFISSPVNSSIINNLFSIMKSHNISLINVGDVFDSLISQKNKAYFKKHLFYIPNYQKYGISTSSSLWERGFLLQKLGKKDYSAWQFEIDRCNEASSPEGLGGILLCDDRKPFNVSTLPVVIQGKVYPKARYYFHKKGYIFTTCRPNMSVKEVFIYDLKVAVSKIRFGRKIFKWLGTKIFGIKFFT